MILQPVFVLAPTHGQSSRIAAMMGAHPDAFVVPELNLTLADQVGDLLGMFEMTDAAELDNGLLRTVAELFGPGQTEEGLDYARNWLKWRSGWRTDQLLEEIARRVAPRQLVVPDISSPLRADLMLRLDSQFPDAPWIHVYRHPRLYSEVVVAELHDRLFVPPDYLDHGEKFDPPMLDPQMFWYRIHLMIDRAAATRAGGAATVLGVRAEAVLSAPELELARLAGWLGWRTDPAAIEAMMHPEWSPFAKLGPQGARSGFDPEFFESPHFEYRLRAVTTLDGVLPWRKDGRGFEAEVKQLAASYGYA